MGKSTLTRQLHNVPGKIRNTDWKSHF